MLHSPLVEQAMRVAARSHRDQLRKASDLPYLTHPACVALILCRAGFHDDHLLAAALLHDVMEDTGYSAEHLAREFPPQVVAYVTALTEHKLTPDGQRRSWETRKQEHIEQIAHAPLEARAIVLADKLHNLATMLYDLEAGVNIWQRFNAPPDRIVWYHREMIDHAAGQDERLRQLAEACRDLLRKLEAAIEPEPKSR